MHGVRITLKMHPSEPTDHADMEEFQEDIQKLNQYVDKQSSIYEQFHMKMVGTYTTPCKRLDIADGDKIVKIKMLADDEKLRGISVHLASGVIETFGAPWGTNFVSRKHRHELSDKIDLLGLFGYVKRVPAGPQTADSESQDIRDEYIVALGFIQNECPTRDVIDYERNFVIPDKQQNKDRRGDGRMPTGLVVVLSCLTTAAVMLSIIIAYFCLKNRVKFSTIGKKAQE